MRSDYGCSSSGGGLALAGAAILGAPPVREAAAFSILWGAPEFVGSDAPTNASVYRAHIALTDSVIDPQLGVVAEQFYPSVYGRNKSEFVYYERDEDGTWDRQGAFTDGPIPDGTPYNTDEEFAFDRRDSVHAVFEANSYPNVAGNVHIGYKCQGDTIWDSPDVVWVSDPGVGGDNSPRMFLDPARERLHVTWSKGLHAERTMYYRAKSTDPDSSAFDGWGEIITIDSLGGGVPAIVSDPGDGHAVLHLIGGKRWTAVDENKPDTTAGRHLWGPPPGLTDTTWVPTGFEQWGKAAVGQPPSSETDFSDLIEVAASPAAGPGGGGPYIYLVGEPILAGSNDQVITFTTIDTSTMTWTPSHTSDPLVISVRDDGMESGTASIAVDDSGIHVIWQDRPVGQTDTADLVLHRHTAVAVPSSLGDWSPIANVVADDSSTSMNPAIAVEDSVLFVAYSRLVDSLTTCGPSGNETCYEHALYFREGHIFTDSTNAPMTWANSVFLDRDFVVPAGDTLTIEPGTIIELAGKDQYDRGVDAAHIEIIVRPGAMLVAEGTAESPIAFRSAAAGSTWYGIALGSLAGTAPSSLHYVDFKDALYAVTVDSLSGDLVHCTFDGAAVADVYLPQDTRIPVGYEWILDAPTRVVADTLSTQDDVLGTSGLCDLIVLGNMETQRPGSAQPEDLVIFESTDKDSVLADDWGGITIGAGGQATLHDCDIAFALRGVYFAAANSPEIVDSHVHHYSEEGIYDYASNALIQGCVVERGEDLDPTVETTAVRAHSSLATILDNRIDWQTDKGIWVGFNSFLCKSQPWGEEAEVAIVGNRVTGDFDTYGSERPSSAGIRAEYICHDFSALVESDTVSAWSGRALDLWETADTDIRCSVFEESHIAARYYRTKYLQSYEGDVVLAQDRLRTSSDSNLLVAGDAVGLTGLVLSSTGQNSLQKNYSEPLSSNIKLDTSSSFPDTLSAINQAWLDATGAVISDSAAVDSTLDRGLLGGTVFFMPLGTEESTCVGSGARRQDASGLAANLDERLAKASPRVHETVPDKWSAALGGANPTAGDVRLVIGAPAESVVRVVAYDVAGRRVATLHDGWLGAGFHELRWSAARSGGRPLGSGVYFLRVETPGFRTTRKVVVLSDGG